MNLSILFVSIFILNFVPAKLERRIAGGKKVGSRRPYMAYLIREVEEKYINETHKTVVTDLCTGTIISEWHILTAAHCAYRCWCKRVEDTLCDKCEYFKPEAFSIYTGVKVISSDAPKSSVNKWHYNPDHRFYDTRLQCAITRDIAIAELKEKLIMGPNINTVKLPPPVRLDDVNLTTTLTTRFGLKEKFCTSVGWGDSVYDDPAPFEGRVLKAVRLMSISTENCLSYIHLHHEKLPPNSPERSLFQNFGFCVDTHICAMDPLRDGHSTCQGDSGGPLMCNMIQVGVVFTSIDDDCSGLNPLVYARLDVNMEWINKVIKSHL